VPFGWTNGNQFPASVAGRGNEGHSQHDLTKLCGSRNWSLLVVGTRFSAFALGYVGNMYIGGLQVGGTLIAIAQIDVNAPCPTQSVPTWIGVYCSRRAKDAALLLVLTHALAMSLWS